MDIRRAVSEFVAQGKGLFQRMRTNGEALSDVELMTLREQLHILDTEAGHLQDLKEFRSRPLLSTPAKRLSASMSRSQHRAA